MRVAVIGAGWAGLSAALELSTQDFHVTVFDSSLHLGGRARGFTHKGVMLDNGQHILLGAYRETLRLMGQLGIQNGLLRLPLRLESPPHFSLSTSPLPAPLNLLVGLLKADGLTFQERLAALRFITDLRLKNFTLSQDKSVGELLSSQPQKLNRYLWEPLCLAALNTPLKDASAQVFLNVLRDAFARKRADSDLLLPRCDLSTLFPKAAVSFIEQHGGEIRLGNTIGPLEPKIDGISVNGEVFDEVICAVHPHALPTLIGRLPELAGTVDAIKKFTYQPIATVYLQYPPNITLDFPILGLMNGYAQWVLDRGVLCGQSGLLAAVISAEGDYLKLSHEALADHVQKQLQVMIYHLPKPEWEQVIVEKRATFSCVPALQRPENATPHPRLWLAGDYTKGDYPSTLEGAVRSGTACARHISAKLAP